MNTLNCDCIREILELLDLKDQISLLQVNSLLNQAVRSLWMVQYKRQAIKFLEINLSDKEYEIFFNVIKDFAEVLELRLMDKHKYEILKSCTYPHVKNLRLTIHPCFLTDEDVLDLYRLFPNLTAFSPHGNLTGKYLDLWSDLKELNFSYCYKLDVGQFHHIMGVLQLEHVVLNMFPISRQCEQLDLQRAHVEHLKYLRLNTYELYYFLAQPLPSLKDLIITNQYNPRQLFDVILSSWEAPEIRKVETANVENVLANCLEMRMNIEEICIINDRNVLPQNVVRSLHNLTELRKLRLKNCQLYTVNIMKLLRSIPQVDEISLEECRLEEHHLQLNVLQIVENRTKMLRLNFYENQPRNLRCATNRESINVSRDRTGLTDSMSLKIESTQLIDCEKLSPIPSWDVMEKYLYLYLRQNGILKHKITIAI